MFLFNLKPLQPISILTLYGTLGEGVTVYIFYNLWSFQQPMVRWGGYNIKLLLPITMLTAYSTLGILQRKASTTNSHSNSRDHSWGNKTRSHYNQYLFSNVYGTWGEINIKPLQPQSIPTAYDTLSQIVRKT